MEQFNSLAEFVRHHNTANDGQRLGQRFVNTYISQPWPSLFYETSDKKSWEMIIEWLEDHQYLDTMPPLAKERS